MPRSGVARSYGNSIFSFQGTFILFSIVPVANNVGRFPFQNPFQLLLFADFLMVAVLTGMR